MRAPRSAARVIPLVERYAPIATIVLALIAIWYVAAVAMNWSLVRDAFEREETPYTDHATCWPAPWMRSVRCCRRRTRSIDAFVDGVFGYPPLAPRSLVYHSLVTLSATLLGFVLGALLGIALALMIVHSRVLERSLLPWIICSQMVPILALAPIFIVVLGAIGLQGLLPKSIISAYLCFFPITIGMVKGFTSPDPLQLELMRTWSATPRQVLWKLRWPSAVPYLFASLKVAITISLIGAIVAELPTGARSRHRRAAAVRLLLRPDHPALGRAGRRRRAGLGADRNRRPRRTRRRPPDGGPLMDPRKLTARTFARQPAPIALAFALPIAPEALPLTARSDLGRHRRRAACCSCSRPGWPMPRSSCVGLAGVLLAAADLAGAAE